MSCCDELRSTHDLSLSDWGPYARDFYGLSRIADRDLGIRLDFFMAPGILRRAFFPPEPLRECGCSPWEAAPDLRYFMFRQQMEGRNLFYTDTAYAEIDRDLWLGRIESWRSPPTSPPATSWRSAGAWSPTSSRS